jgi:hypothetical protein
MSGRTLFMGCSRFASDLHLLSNGFVRVGPVFVLTRDS